MLYDAMLYDAMLCYAMLCYTMLCYAVLCYAMLCYVMLCYAMLCYAMLCYAMHRKSLRNRSKIDPKSVQDRLRNRPRCQHRFWTVLEPFSDRSGPALGGLLAASRGSSWGQVGPKIDFWRSWMAFKNEHDAGYLSEPIFGRFGGDLGVQNRPKIGPESVSRAIMT